MNILHNFPYFLKGTKTQLENMLKKGLYTDKPSYCFLTDTEQLAYIEDKTIHIINGKDIQKKINEETKANTSPTPQKIGEMNVIEKISLMVSNYLL